MKLNFHLKLQEDLTFQERCRLKQKLFFMRAHIYNNNYYIYSSSDQIFTLILLVARESRYSKKQLNYLQVLVFLNI